MGWFDESLYPDVPSPKPPVSEGERIDFIARLCGAWDFGVLPRKETINEVRKSLWRKAVEECRLLGSVSYHLLRKWHGLPLVPYLGPIPAYIREDPQLQHM